MNYITNYSALKVMNYISNYFSKKEMPLHYKLLFIKRMKQLNFIFSQYKAWDEWKNQRKSFGKQNNYKDKQFLHTNK